MQALLVLLGVLWLAHHNELVHPATVFLGGLRESLSSFSLSSLTSPRLITAGELAAHAAPSSPTSDESPTQEWLALLGHVYDVSSGKQFYGPGGAYSFFTGKDGSRAFVTGQFDEEGLVPDLTGLGSEEHLVSGARTQKRVRRDGRCPCVMF